MRSILTNGPLFYDYDKCIERLGKDLPIDKSNIDEFFSGILASTLLRDFEVKPTKDSFKRIYEVKFTNGIVGSVIESLIGTLILEVYYNKERHVLMRFSQGENNKIGVKIPGRSFVGFKINPNYYVWWDRFFTKYKRKIGENGLQNIICP